MPRTWKRKLGRFALAVFVLVLLAIAAATAAAWRGFGRRAVGSRSERMARSAQWKHGHFENPQPLVNDPWGSLLGLCHISDHVSPHLPVPTVAVDQAQFQSAPPTGLRVTWLGHSSVLVEIDGYRVVTDPMWSQRASPVAWVGPKRWYDPLIALGSLPRIDAVVISHDHYDHLDRATIVAMAAWDTKFIVPLGVGAHLEYWGVPPAKIVELDWWEHVDLAGLKVHCTPARHASGRTVVTDKDATLWAGYALQTSKHRVYFSGDTGLFPAMREIGKRLGPFDLTMIETGQYDRSWPDWHIGPEQAVLAHTWVQGRVFLPIHWGLFALAYHGWTEPVERVLVAAAKANVQVLLPKPGQSLEPGTHPAAVRWWPRVPWQTSEQNPVVSTKAHGP